MSDCKTKMDKHWRFLEEFIHIVVYDSPNIVMTDEQIDAFEEEMKSIEYGFRLSWPHAWKHGKDEEDETKGDKF